MNDAVLDKYPVQYEIYKESNGQVVFQYEFRFVYRQSC